MTVVTAPDSVEMRLDQLSLQVAEVAAELRWQRQQRERWSELVADASPVLSGAYDMVARELEDLSSDVTIDDAAQLARTAARALPVMESLLRQLEAVNALGQELVPLASPAMQTATAALQQLDEKGYFAFARGGAAIVDQVVTSFTEDDVQALGENVVLILNTVKEMTQPEVMTLLQRTALTAQEVDDEFTEPPSTFALLRQMRDPETRRGLGRVLAMLRTVGADQKQAPSTPREER